MKSCKYCMIFFCTIVSFMINTLKEWKITVDLDVIFLKLGRKVSGSSCFEIVGWWFEESV
jgi:hypothetical protein